MHWNTYTILINAIINATFTSLSSLCHKTTMFLLCLRVCGRIYRAERDSLFSLHYQQGWLERLEVRTIRRLLHSHIWCHDWADPMGFWLELGLTQSYGLVPRLGPESKCLQNQHLKRSKWKVNGLLWPSFKSYNMPLAPSSIVGSSHKLAQFWKAGT